MKENLVSFINYLKSPFLIQTFLRFFLVLTALEFTVFNITVNAQTTQRIAVSGSVIDGATKESLPFVNVVVEGTTVGVLTDLQGRFTLYVPNAESSLTFSFIGYKTQIVAVGDQRQFSIALMPDFTALEEVVVVGYGTQKKESVVGAISQASGELVKQGAQGSDLGVALTGALPGMAVVRTNSRPGGKDYGGGGEDDFAYLYIRGKKTWNNSSPLVLVDGVERELYNLNPEEIENVSLLKDASATAVFGVKGANGVILITTLRGKVGKPVITVNAQGSAKTISRIPKVLNSYETNLMKNYAIMNEVPVNAPSWNSIVPYKYVELFRTQQYPEYLPDVDWADEFTKNFAYDQKLSFNVSGGTKFVKYFGSLSYLHEGDIYNLQDVGQGYSPNTTFDRINFRSNLDFDITKSTRFSASLAGYFLGQQKPAGSYYAAWTIYSRPRDMFPPRYSDGVYANWSGFTRYSNPFYDWNLFGYSLNRETSLTTDFSLTQKLDFVTKGLSFTGKLSFDNRFNSSGPSIAGYGDICKFIKPQIVDEIKPGMTPEEITALENKYTEWDKPATTGTSGFDWVKVPNSYSTETASTGSTYRRLYYELNLNYARDFRKHSVTGLVLFSRQEDAAGSTFMNYREDWVGRATYTYDKKYLFELNGAYNGSEKFGPRYRFGFFPAMGLGWVVSNENFFEHIRPFVNKLKLRYSDGKIGSDAGVARWLYVGSWTVQTGTVRLGAPYLQAQYPLRYEGTIPNEDIHWETTHKRDFGIETAYFKNSLKINFDFFTEDRSDIFISGADRPVPDYLGTSPVSANLGRVKAHGWEFELNYSGTTAGKFSYWFNHSWTFAKDKIIERADPELKPWYQKQAGYQIDQPRVILNQSTYAMSAWNDVYNHAGGSTNTYLLPGDFARVDYNSDGLIDANDQIPYGYPTRPQFTYAPSAGFAWKNFSGNVRFYGVYNVEGSIGVYRNAFSEQFGIAYPWNKKWAWSPEFNNSTAALNPALRWQTGATTGYIDNPRTYARLQHAEIAYNIENPFLRKLGISNFRFIISGDNLALWTTSKTFDDFDAPQITSSVEVRRSYPVLKNYNVGINFNFQ